MLSSGLQSPSNGVWEMVWLLGAPGGVGHLGLREDERVKSGDEADAQIFLSQ